MLRKPDGVFFAYAIAGAKTLALIDRLESRAAAARVKLAEIAKDAGGTLALSANGRTAFFQFPRMEEDLLPDGWEKRFPSACRPNDTTKESRNAKAAIEKHEYMLNIEERFTEACENSRGVLTGPSSYSFEKIGEKTVVICPPIIVRSTTVEHYVPDDSQVISYNDYLQMKRDAGLLQADQVIKTFEFRADYR